MNQKLTLVTGANGFVGLALCKELMARGMHARGATRTVSNFSNEIHVTVVGDIYESTNWKDALRGVDVVIHLAARVHVKHDNVVSPLDEFHRINTVGTEQLARNAAASGVKRLVYVSSIGVNGLFTRGEVKFSEQDASNPHNAYAISKW